MNKYELAVVVADKVGMSKKDGGVVIEAIIESITEALASGDKVSLIGFGSFSVSDRAARDGVNPSTGAKIRIEASKVAKFKVGAQLKAAVKK